MSKPYQHEDDYGAVDMPSPEQIAERAAAIRARNMQQKLLEKSPHESKLRREPRTVSVSLNHSRKRLPDAS